MRDPDDDQSYYLESAATSRDLAKRAASPVIAAIHAEFATRYDLLSGQPERQHASFSMGTHAA